MGLFDKFKKGLARTRDKIVNSIASVLPVGRKIDDQLLDELYETLVLADMGVASVDKLIDQIRAAWKSRKIENAEDIVPFIKTELVEYWPQQDRTLHFAETGPTVIMVTGVNGSGKTTSVAKLTRYLTDQGKTVILGACDTFRAAAVEQLTIWSERTGVQIVKHQTGADPGAVAFDACQAAVSRDADVLLIDTAGRLHTQDHLMRELTKIHKVVGKQIPGAPHEVLLVLDATTGQNAVNQAKQFTEATGVTGIFLAKLDGTAKGGIVVAIRDQVNLPVKFVGLGEQYDDIAPFEPQGFVEALFEGSDLAASQEQQNQ